MSATAHGVELTRCPHMPDDGKSRAGFGWVYRFGSVSLFTCRRRGCAPTAPGWFKAIRLVATGLRP